MEAGEHYHFRRRRMTTVVAFRCPACGVGLQQGQNTCIFCSAWLVVQGQIVFDFAAGKANTNEVTRLSKLPIILLRGCFFDTLSELQSLELKSACRGGLSENEGEVLNRCLQRVADLTMAISQKDQNEG
jgi:hypothetical protein